jgi:ABC-type Zn uptake system ZnuABC Zn-binding protein ZnuA
VVRALLIVLAAAAPAWGRVVDVVTTSTDLKALVEAVGRDGVRVTSLAPAVHEPHVVDLKPSQLAALKSAVLLVRVGLDHEPWLLPVLESSDGRRFRPGSPAVLDCSKGIALLPSETGRGRDERAGHLAGNPHYWLDPDNARPITAAIRDALARIAPSSRDSFENNRAGFLALLDERLERWTRAMAPHRGTRIAVGHDTWAYFARRFGLVVAGTVEPWPGVPPTPAHLAELVRRMRESNVRLLISGPEANAAMIALVAAQSGARPLTLFSSVGGDAAARSYVGLFDVNIKRLTEALGGQR